MTNTYITMKPPPYLVVRTYAKQSGGLFIEGYSFTN